jgi:putative ABC transport system permease protein
MKQYWSLLWMNLAGIPQRLGLVATIVIGVGCAVGVLVSMLAMGAGARREAMGNVRPDRAGVLSVDAQGPMQSSLSRDVAAQIRDLPGIRRNAAGKPIAIAQILVFVQARDKVSGAKVNFPLAGVTQGLTDYAPELHLTSGRLFRPGLREMIASNMCARKFANFALGDKRPLRRGDWTIVGTFDMGQAQGNCAVYADAEVILTAFGRATFNQVNVMLDSPARFAAFADAVKANPTLRAQVKSEAQLTEESIQQLRGILNFVSYFVGTIMAVAATLGAVNSLYAVVDGRRRELATLRALGFRGIPVVASILTESILLAVPGALLGVGLAWLLFNGLTASPFGFSFHLAVTVSTVATGITWALVMGALGGALPAVRAARVPVTVALRAI